MAGNECTQWDELLELSQSGLALVDLIDRLKEQDG